MNALRICAQQKCVHDSIHHRMLSISSTELQSWGFRTKTKERHTGEAEGRERQKKVSCMIFHLKILFLQTQYFTKVQCLGLNK